MWGFMALTEIIHRSKQFWESPSRERNYNSQDCLVSHEQNLSTVFY